MDARHQAILLLGPTGSGKTPLGQLLERKGLGSQRCFHFDFGEELRAITRITRPNKLWPVAETGFIRKLLKEGGLLENEWFFLAEKIRLFKFKSLRQKFTGYILSLSGKQHSDNVTLPYTREKLAELFGVARPSLSRVCSEMSDKGLVELDGKTVTILDKESLEESLDY